MASLETAALHAAPPAALVGTGLDEISDRLGTAQSSVLLAAPFLSQPIANILAAAAENGDATDRRLIVALNRGAVSSGVLSTDGVGRFLDAGFEVRSLCNLHAKVALTDDAWGLVGSGNFTYAGLKGGNAELGVRLDADSAHEARTVHFDPWWDAARPVDHARLEQAKQDAPPTGRAIRRLQGGFGGVFHATLPETIARRGTDVSESGYWLKVMHGRPERIARSYWTSQSWINDAHTLVDGRPTRRPSYKVGDLLVVYLGSGARKACPAIMRVEREPEYEPERVRAESSIPDDADRWSWVTPVSCLGAIDLEQAPTLADLDIHHYSVRQQSRIRLSGRQFHRALAAIKDR